MTKRLVALAAGALAVLLISSTFDAADARGAAAGAAAAAEGIAAAMPGLLGPGLQCAARSTAAAARTARTATPHRMCTGTATSAEASPSACRSAFTAPTPTPAAAIGCGAGVLHRQRLLDGPLLRLRQRLLLRGARGGLGWAGIGPLLVPVHFRERTATGPDPGRVPARALCARALG